MFAKSEAVQEILDSLIDEEKQTFVGKVKEILAQFKQWISELLGLYKSDSAEAEALRKAADDIDALTKMWDDMLKKSLTANKALETAKARENKNSADKDGVVQYSFKEYSEHQKENWKNSKKIVLYENENQYRSFIETSISDKQFNKKIYFGAITKSQAERIKIDTNIDVENYNCSLSANEIRKMFKDHGSAEKESLRGQRAITVTDVVQIPQVLLSPDKISLSSKTYNGKPVINFVKNTDGTMTVSAVVSDKHLDLFVQTAFAGIKKGNLATPIADQAAINTSETSSGTVSANSISDSSKKINDKTVNNVDVQFAEKNYSYEALTSKPDMKLVTVGDNTSTNRVYIVSEAIKNAKTVGRVNENGNSVVMVDDINTEVVVPKRSIVHGLDRRLSTQAPVMVKIGEVLKNSIRINELVPKTENIAKTYDLIGAAKTKKDDIYIVNFVVNQFSNEVSKIDVLYSANVKKEPAAFLPKITDESATPTGSNISISDLLEYVNMYFPDILPESVLRHFGHTERPKGKLGESVLYSDKTTENDTDLLKSLLDEEELRSLKEREVLYQNKIKRLSEQLKSEKEPSKGKVYEHNISGTAAHLLEHYGSKYKKSELVKDLDELYDRMIALPGTVKDFAYGIASKVYDGITAKKTVDENAASLLAELKTRRIKLDSEQLAEIENSHGDGWRTFFRNRVVIDNKNGTPLDKVWKELSDTYPDRFVSDISSADQPTQLLDIIDDLRRESEVEEVIDAENFAEDFAEELFDSFWNLKPYTTAADKYEQKLAELRKRNIEKSKARTVQIREKLAEQKSQARSERREADKAEILEDLKRFEEYIKLEKKYAYSKHIDPKTLNMVTKWLREKADTNYQKFDFAKQIGKVYTYIK